MGLWVEFRDSRGLQVARFSPGKSVTIDGPEGPVEVTSSVAMFLAKEDSVFADPQRRRWTLRILED